MKKNTLLAVALLSMLLSACGGNQGGGSDSNVSTSEDNAHTLEAPVLTLNDEQNGLIWSTVENAVSYELKVNDGEAEAATSYAFATEAGNYSVQVRAIGDGVNYETSEYSVPFTYETQLVNIEKLSNNNGTITLTGVSAKELYVMQGEESWRKISTDTAEYNTTESTNVAFKAVGGYKEETRTYFYGLDVVKSMYATHLADASKPYVIENGDDCDGEYSDTDLQDKYSITKWTNDWTPVGATAVYSTENKGVTPNKCIKLQYWRHGAYFKYTKAFEPALVDGYNAITFYAKGDDVSTLTLALVCDDGAYKGVYITYSITAVPSIWTKYTVRFDDDNWKINYGGGTITQQYASQVTGYSSMAEMLPVFTSFDFRVVADPDDNWSQTYMYLDEVQLEVSNEPTKKEVFVNLSENYCGKTDTCAARVHVTGNTATATVTIGGVESVVPMNVTKDGEYVTFTSSEDEGATLVYTAKASKGGSVLTYESATGSAAEYVNNLNLNSYTIVDDFESYSETGTGYDQSHTTESARTGLRGAYYSDYYYSGGSGSYFGGNGWSLMGSSDYLGLDTANGHSGHSAQIKAPTSNVCRYTSYGIVKGNAEPIGTGDTISFWARNSYSYETQIKFRVFYIPSVDSKTHVSEDGTISKVATVTIPANSDWAEYTMSINTKYSVYGYNFTTQKHSGLAYIQIDDIAIYNSACSPWSK